MRPRWQSVPLGSEVKLLSGGTPKKSDPRYWDGDIPWVSSGEMTRRQIHDTQHRVTEEAVGNGTKLVPENTVLVVVRGMSLAKEFRVSLTKRPVTFNQDLKALQPSARVDPGFLFYYLQSQKNAIRDSATDASHGTKKLETRVLKSWPLPLPDLGDQRAIRDTLCAYDDLIENNRRRIQLLEQAARLLYREWFVHLRFPGHEHVTIAAGVPEGWERTTIGRFVNDGRIGLQTGPFGTQLRASDYAESGVPVINVRNIGYGVLRPERVEFLPEQKAESLTKHVLQAGDIVFGRKGAVDRHLLVGNNEAGWIQGSDCIRMRLANPQITARLLSLAFGEETHKKWMLSQCGNKATMASLNQGVIARISILVPSRKVLLLFDEHASMIRSQVELLDRQSAVAAKGRDLILPRLMSGETAASALGSGTRIAGTAVSEGDVQKSL